MRIKNTIRIAMIFIMVILVSSLAGAVYTRSTPQFTQFQSADLFGFQSSLEFDKSMCEAGQDFVIQIAPFGCTPAVVRSDLLEEQNVPIFCQLAATKINPLIDVEAIESISFEGEYPNEVAGIGFQPARAALGVTGDLNSPVLENIGYVVIVLKKQDNVSKMPEYVTGTLNAKIKYDIKNAFGIGESSYYLPMMSDADWDEYRTQYSFWNSKGYLRAEEIGLDSAAISVYDDTNKLRTVTLEKGKTSDKIQLPGFDCLATLQLKLNDLKNPDTTVKLGVGTDVIEVIKGEKFLEGKCYVTNIENLGVRQTVKIVCKEDESAGTFGLGKSFTLVSSPKVRFTIEGSEKIVGVGDKLYDYDEGAEQRSVFVAYVGSVKGSTDLKVLLLSVPISSVKEGKLSDSDLITAANTVKTYDWDAQTRKFKVANLGQKVLGAVTNIFNFIFQGQTTEILSVDGSTVKFSKNIKLIGFAEPVDEEFTGNNANTLLNNYENAKKDYTLIKESFASEKTERGVTYGEDATFNYITLAISLGQKGTAAQLCKEFIEKYPNSKQIGKIKGECSELKLSSSETASTIVFVNGKSRLISLEGISEPTQEQFSADVFIRAASGKTETINLQKGSVYYIDYLRFGQDVDINLGSNWGAVGGVVTTATAGIITPEDVHMKFDSKTSPNQWLWNAYDSGWKPTNSENVNPYKRALTNLAGLTEAQVNFISSFTDKSYEEGVLLISQYRGAESIELLDLDTDAAKLRVSVSKGAIRDVKDFLISDSETLKLNEAKVLGDYSFTLKKVNLIKKASVTVIPGIENAGSNTTFQFNVGIEKRSIELSPQKTEKIIKSVNESIKELESISENLGDLVKGLKGACLGVGAALTVKNFFANVGGKGIARQNVMRQPGGWTERCTAMSGPGKTYTSVSKCYTENADAIEQEVNIASDIIKQQNARYKKEQEGAMENGGNFANKVVNTNKFMQTDIPVVSGSLTKDSKYYYAADGTKVDMTDLLKYDAYSTQGLFTTNEIREIDYNSQIMNNPQATPAMINSANRSLQSIYGKIHGTSNSYIERQAETTRLGGIQPDVVASKELKEVRYANDIRFSQVSSKYSGATIDANAKVRPLLDPATGNNYLLVLDDSGRVVQQTYLVGTSGELTLQQGTNLLGISYTKVDSTSYKNTYKSPELNYFETGPYKGLPAIVPVDTTNGWYASLKQTLPVFGGISAYDASGRVTSFYLCNVGINGLEENRGGDDICQQINTGTGQPYNQFAGLSETEAKTIINKAVQAIAEASNKYKSGISGQMSILGQLVNIGSPAADIPDMQCEDLMSPKDCRLLFNVCDPVVCPSSRCNLGGAYPVKDVVQSGIIGSLVLCLPNFPQVFIPVCLTGVQAGIDGWLSVQTAYRDCMQESLDTGKMTGICDEIYGLHACEFFWRQSVPIAKLAIPKLIEVFTGNNAARGGGEYLGVQNAWNNAQSSFNFFTQYYAANSFKAFQARSTEQVGGEICNAFVSGVYPTGDFLDTFTDPDSPSQFYGRFDEIPFTSTTNPPISQYKVYYHIYAGKDAGASYKVFLMGDTSSSYYMDTSSSRLVASGFVKKGEYATETKDFTANSGYKQLCINVNGQEECGFKETSTSFAINYVEDKYIQEQANQTDIKSETECVSGSVSAYSLLSPSVEGAAQEMLNPSIYNRGLIRVCASLNPGQGTDPYAGTQQARWIEVGNCGNSNIKCWLDTQSVKDIIENRNIENETIQDLNTNAESNLALLVAEGQYVKDFKAEVTKIEDQGDNTKKIEMINSIYNKVFYNNQKAKLLSLRAGAYGVLAKEAFEVTEQGKARAREDVRIADFNMVEEALKNIFLGDNLDVQLSKLTISKYENVNDERKYTLSDGTIVSTDTRVTVSPGVYIDLQAARIYDSGKDYYVIYPDRNIVATFKFSESYTGTPSTPSVTPIPEATTPTTPSPQAITLDDAINQISSLKGKASDPANLDFVAKLVEDMILTAAESADIVNNDRDISYIRELLLRKKTQQQRAVEYLYRDRLKDLSIYEVGINSNKVLTGSYYTVGRINEINGQYIITFGTQFNAINSLTGTKILTEEEAKEILCNFRYPYIDNDGKNSELKPIVVERAGVYPKSGIVYTNYAANCVPTLLGTSYVAPTLVKGELPTYPAIITLRFSFVLTSMSYRYDRTTKQWMADKNLDGEPELTLEKMYPRESNPKTSQATIIQALYDLRNDINWEKRGYECFTYLQQNPPTGFFSGLESISGVPTNFEAKKCFNL